MDFGWLWIVNVGSSLLKKKNHSILVSDIDNGGGYVCVIEQGYMENLCIYLSILL